MRCTIEYQYSCQYSYEYLSTCPRVRVQVRVLLLCNSRVRVPEIQYSSTASTEYEYPSPDQGDMPYLTCPIISCSSFQATGGGGAAAKKPKPDTSTINLEAEAKAKRVRTDENLTFDTWMDAWMKWAPLCKQNFKFDIVNWTWLKPSFHILIWISLMFVPEGPIDNESA